MPMTPKAVFTTLDSEDLAKLEACCELEKLKVSDILRRAVRLYHRYLMTGYEVNAKQAAGE